MHCALPAPVSQAYDTLSDMDLRAKYNTQLEQALQDTDEDYTGESGVAGRGARNCTAS